MRVGIGGLLLAVGLLLAGRPSPARATVLADVPIEDMAADADVIAIGEVLRVGTRLELGGARPEPWTVAHVRVTRFLRGDDGASEIAIEERGGDTQGLSQRIAGTPRYAPRERVLVFLRRDDEGRLRTWGMALGKLVLLPSVDGGVMARRDLRDVALARWQGGAMTVVDGPGVETFTLEELLARIERAIGSSP